jgi:hypothetical protein
VWYESEERALRTPSRRPLAGYFRSGARRFCHSFRVSDREETNTNGTLTDTIGTLSDTHGSFIEH